MPHFVELNHFAFELPWRHWRRYTNRETVNPNGLCYKIVTYLQ